VADSRPGFSWIFVSIVYKCSINQADAASSWPGCMARMESSMHYADHILYIGTHEAIQHHEVAWHAPVSNKEPSHHHPAGGPKYLPCCHQPTSLLAQLC
jgi:hypothetical protein